MNRDMDITRQILLATAALPIGKPLAELPGIDQDTFALHVVWLQEAGLVVATVKENGQNIRALVRRLTWQGCDFVDAIRDETLWQRAKESVLRPSMSFTFDLLKDWLKSDLAQGFPTLRTLGQ